ncbi:Peroxidase 21 [Capsicum chinense]|nr:Peroxidase 21 [Capsicum chinense]
MRNFKYVETIKEALENECPNTVSCADIVVLSARNGVVMLGGPHIEMKTGRRGESKESYLAEVDNFIPNHNDSMSLVLSRFKTIGVDAQGTVALLGAHSVGRVHCVNIIHRLYPTVDSTLDPDYATYLKTRCPSPQPSPNVTEFARNDRETPMVWDNLYYKNILSNKGLLSVDQQLVSDPITYPFVEKFAASNSYFHAQFGKALIILSEKNHLLVMKGRLERSSPSSKNYFEKSLFSNHEISKIKIHESDFETHPQKIRHGNTFNKHGTSHSSPCNMFRLRDDGSVTNAGINMISDNESVPHRYDVMLMMRLRRIRDDVHILHTCIHSLEGLDLDLCLNSRVFELVLEY